MDVTVDILSRTAGRDKFIRTTQYALMVVAGSLKGPMVTKLGGVAKQLSSARLVLRLYDDPSMLKNILNYGLGRHEQDLITRLTTLVGSWSITAFYPVEHIAFLGDHKFLPVESQRWYSAGVVLWAIYLVMAVLKGFRRISILRQQKAKFIKKRKLESPDKNDSAANATFRQEMRRLSLEEIKEYWSLIKSGADLVNAIHFLPGGYLWSGKLSTFQNGIFGVTSSLIGLLQMYFDSWK